jgi:YD repeat-containing protein
VVNVASPSNTPHGSISTTEYNAFNAPVRTLSADNRLRALEAGANSEEVSKRLDTEYVYNGERGEEGLAEPGTQLVEKKGPEHSIRLEHPGTGEEKEEEAREVATYTYDTEARYNEAENNESEVPAPGGESFDLLTETQSFAEPRAHNTRVEERTSRTFYAGEKNLGWKLRAPTSTITDPKMVNHRGGLNITDTTVYYTTHEEAGVAACDNHPEWEGLVCETRGPAGKGGNSAHDARTIYYSVKGEAGIPACENRPEWAGLVCQTQPIKQPEDPESTHAPRLPVSTTQYNIYDQPETVTEEYGAVTRTKAEHYDAAGRLVASKTTSTDSEKEKSLPEVTYGYSQTTGQQTTETAEGVTLESVFNSLGQLLEYKDGRGNTTHYTYEEPDGLVTEVRDSAEEGRPYDEGRSFQRYAYDATTKALVSLEDSSFPGRPFTATYDAEGNLTNELYPNGMCAVRQYDATGSATSLQYVKSTNCSESGAKVWYAQTLAPSIHGETLLDKNTLAEVAYAYDQSGRLGEAQETPQGKGCTTRLYAYNTEGMRTSLTTREPKGNGECATEGGSVQELTYDEANRLIDAGVEYDALGNATKMPAADAGGNELSTEYYVDNQVLSQTQAAKKISYLYDPEGRTRSTASGGKEVALHYDGAGHAVSWESEVEGAQQLKLTRNIPGIDGTLSAIQENGAEPVILMHDLQGDVVGRCAANAGAEAPTSMYNSTEFGVPTTPEPPKYSWLGASGVSSERPSGVIVEGGTSYVPETGMTVQPEAVEPPALPGGSGGGAAFVSPEEPWLMQAAGQRAAEAPGLEAGREIEAAIAACQANSEACDPEGIMTGAQALHFAKYWEEQASKLADKVAGGGCGEEGSLDFVVCASAAIASEHDDLYFASRLIACYDYVHNPRTEEWARGRQGHWRDFVVTGVCYFHYGGWEVGGYRGAEDISVSACWDEPWNANNPGREWWCASGVGRGRRWWYADELDHIYGHLE